MGTASAHCCRDGGCHMLPAPPSAKLASCRRSTGLMCLLCSSCCLPGAACPAASVTAPLRATFPRAAAWHNTSALLAGNSSHSAANGFGAAGHELRQPVPLAMLPAASAWRCAAAATAAQHAVQLVSGPHPGCHAAAVAKVCHPGPHVLLHSCSCTRWPAMQCRHAQHVQVAAGLGSMHRRRAASRFRGAPAGRLTARTLHADPPRLDLDGHLIRDDEGPRRDELPHGGCRQAGKRRQAVGSGWQLSAGGGVWAMQRPRRWAGRHRPLCSSRTVCRAGGRPPPRCCRRRMAGRRPLAGRCCWTCGRYTAPSSSAGRQPAAPAMLHPGDGAQAAPGVTHRSVSPHRSFQEAEADAAGPLGSSCCARAGLSSDPCACTSAAP